MISFAKSSMCITITHQLGQIEVRPTPLPQQTMDIMIKVESKVKQTARNYSSVDSYMCFIQMPPTRTNKEYGCLLLEGVNSTSFGIGVGNFTSSGIAEITLAFSN